MAKPTGLGKGLSALINTGEYVGDTTGYKAEFNMSQISANPFQPRMQIKPEELVEIADSIREHGVIQPLIITKNQDGDGYFIIAGERRFRASQLAGLKTVPVVIKEASPQEMLELALIENVQRQDLNPLEEAYAFKQLQDQFGLTQAQVAKKMGISRTAVTNKIRLLQLPETLRSMVMNEKISEGHARALLGLTEESSLIAAANIVIRRNLSVRETEELVRKINFGKSKTKRRHLEFDQDTKKWLDEYSKTLGFTTTLQRMAKGGKLVIRYTNNDELKDLMGKLK